MSIIPVNDMCEIVCNSSEIKSRRAQILVVLKDVLSTIKKSNGYTLSVDEVSFDVNSWNARTSSNTPVIYIVDDIDTTEIKAGKTRFVDWKVQLFGVVKKRSFIEFEQFISDIHECIEHNYNLGGVISKVEVTGIKTEGQLFSEKEQTHLFEIDLKIEYVRCHGNVRNTSC